MITIFVIKALVLSLLSSYFVTGIAFFFIDYDQISNAIDEFMIENPFFQHRKLLFVWMFVGFLFGWPYFISKNEGE